uniref:Uncharacterized protein n=1 Tax=Medicago truncatula TaxID=3880 RepID=A2Q1I5_MEDTR|nr:hypothetical protein MtrDRAFT_AC155886g3v2 [Medicago truncatula]
MQPLTFIYRGLLTVPKVESILPLNPHSLISTDLSVGVRAGTHPPPFQEPFLTYSTTLKSSHSKHRQSPSDQVMICCKSICISSLKIAGIVVKIGMILQFYSPSLFQIDYRIEKLAKPC